MHDQWRVLKGGRWVGTTFLFAFNPPKTQTSVATTTNHRQYHAMGGMYHHFQNVARHSRQLERAH